MDNINKVSMITSIFRSKRHIMLYAYHLIKFAKLLYEAEIDFEVIIIANDPSVWERCVIRDLAARILDYCNIKILSVERETLYKSWNRGIRESTGDIVGFWNVDDIRNPHAVIDSLEQFRQGAKIVSLPFPLITTTRNRKHVLSIKYYDAKYLSSHDPESEYILVPFFLVSKKVFEKVGLFDEQFYITGDYEWQLRAKEFYSFEIAQTIGGVFFSDGANLSGQGHLRHRVENNVIYRRYAMFNKLMPLTPTQHKMLNEYEIEQIIISNEKSYINRKQRIIEPKKCPIMSANRCFKRLRRKVWEMIH